jgi:hypothetical protein
MLHHTASALIDPKLVTAVIHNNALLFAVVLLPNCNLTG